MIFLHEEPRGFAYRQLMEYAVKKSDAILLVYANYDNTSSYDAKKREFRRLLALSRIKTRSNATWPSNTSLDKNVNFCIDVYKSCDELLQFLYSANSLYGWLWPVLPEDPCFFINGECWFWVCAHEGIAQIDIDTREDRKLIRELGLKHEVLTRNYEPFKEEYKIK